MAFQYNAASLPIIPMATPLLVSINNGDTPTASARPLLVTANMAHKKGTIGLEKIYDDAVTSF